MADYKSYLAANILTEDKQVTYRLLSRALKVHVNAAKEMLYDFHRQQNAKKPGTIHATYLLSGTKRVDEPAVSNGSVKKDGEDDVMQSSPFMSSPVPQPQESGTGETSVLTITLVQEEDLEEVRSQYEDLTSIHIYSLGPHPLKDIQLLSDVTRQIQELATTEDSLEFAPKYGTITNKNVKRRAGRRPPPPPVVIAPVTSNKHQPSKAIPAPKPLSSQPEPKSHSSTAKDFFGSTSSSNSKSNAKEKPKPTSTSNPSSKEGTPNPPPPTLKRESSSLFKAFAKAKPKTKKEVLEDEPMKDVTFDDDDDDDEEEEIYVPPVPKQEVVDTDRKSRKDREAALRKMMDDDDEGDEDEGGNSAVVTPDVATPDVVKEVEDGEDIEDEITAKKVNKDESAEPKPAITVSGGRRRGKRRVMKKKTMKDEEGYLVTKEEAVWESFSEEEPAPKPKPKVQMASSSSAKAKKPVPKAGQGNIMAFFGKKP